VAAGYPKAAAEALATSYGLVPGNVDTLVQAHGTEAAKAAVESIPAAKDTTVTVTETGTTEAQGSIAAIEGTKVDAEVKQAGVDEAQKAIDAIHGKDVSITVSITNLGEIQRQLDNLTAPRTMSVTVNQRPGVAVVP